MTKAAKPKRGRPPRTGAASDQMLRVRMTAAEMRRLEAAAERRGISLAELVRGAVERDIEHG